MTDRELARLGRKRFLREGVRHRIESPGDVLKSGESESFGEIQSPLFPAINVDCLQIGLLVDPVNDDSGVTTNQQVINLPHGSKPKGGPETQ
jgi:hypothetical protein